MKDKNKDFSLKVQGYIIKYPNQLTLAGNPVKGFAS